MSFRKNFQSSLFEIQISQDMELSQLLSEEEAIEVLKLRTDIGSGWIASISTNDDDSFTIQLTYEDSRSNKKRYLCRKMVCNP